MPAAMADNTIRVNAAANAARAFFLEDILV